MKLVIFTIFFYSNANFTSETNLGGDYTYLYLYKSLSSVCTHFSLLKRQYLHLDQKLTPKLDIVCIQSEHENPM